jgi:hypothetical protein
VLQPAEGPLDGAEIAPGHRDVQAAPEQLPAGFQTQPAIGAGDDCGTHITPSL